MDTFDSAFTKSTNGSDTQWNNIQSGSDAAVFAGRIVAYQTNISYYGDQHSHWQQPGNANLYFGYVAKYAQEWNASSDTGPNLSSVLKRDAVPGKRAIVSDVINRPSRGGDREIPFLKMREATADEIAAMRHAVASSQAKIEYSDTAFMKSLARNGSGQEAPSSSPTPKPA
jgi:hypothetical protein